MVYSVMKQQTQPTFQNVKLPVMSGLNVTYRFLFCTDVFHGSGINCIGADANIETSALGTANVPAHAVAICGDQWGVTCPLIIYRFTCIYSFNLTGQQ